MTHFQQKLSEFAFSRNAKGCSQSEINGLDPSGEAELPETYQHFLLVAGHGLDDFLTGSDFTLDELNGTREAANELLVSAGLPALPPTAFVFTMHQGYQFYFLLRGSVYYFREGMSQVEKRFDSFEDFFDSVVANIARKRS